MRVDIVKFNKLKKDINFKEAFDSHFKEGKDYREVYYYNGVEIQATEEVCEFIENWSNLLSNVEIFQAKIHKSI